MSALLPEGISSVTDLPYTLHNAILAGVRWCKIQEMPVEEQPPKRIWLDSEEMERWWAKVEAERRARYGLPPEEKGHDAGTPGVDYEVNDISLIARG